MPPEHTELDAGLWLTITELAARKGVRKSTISEKVSRLIADGKLSTKPGKGKAKLVNLAQYDSAIGEVGDAAKEAGAETKAQNATAQPPAEPHRPQYRDAQTREKEYQADLKFIELERLRGSLISVADLDGAAEEAAIKVGEVLESMLSHEAELASVVVKDGENGLRSALKRIVRGQREQIVAAMKEMAASARKHSAAPSDAPQIQAEMALDNPVE